MPKKKGGFFRKLQWKLILIFMLLIVSVVLITGTFLLSNVSSFYLQRFETQMTNAFESGVAKSLKEASTEERPEESLEERMRAFSTIRFGISDNRDYYILDGKEAKIISSSAQTIGGIELTENLIASMAGKVGNKVSVGLSYMDYEYPIKKGEEVKYIIYITDNKQEVNDVLFKMFTVIAQAVFLSALIAFLIGIFLSRTITVPITHLTNKAGKMAEGDFDTVIEVKSDDEIGTLTNTFNTMALRLKRTLYDISSERDKISVILKNLADGVMAFDLNKEALHINPAAEKMLGINARKKHTFDSIFEKYSIPVTFEQILSDDEEIEKSCVLQIGENVIAAHFAPYKTEYKKSDGVVVALQDITKQQRLDDSRRAFVADVSHELRTPLTNIKSYSETLLDADIDDEATRTSFLKVIDSEADRMTRLVKDLLTLSQLDHSKQHLKLESFSLGALAENIVNTMSMDAKKRRQILTYVKGGGTDFVFADKDRISQVVVNIVSNALKYTPEGGNITVVSGQQEQSVYVKISDAGMGIPEKDLPHIFDRFYRVDKARSRKMGGTGLGLAIAKEIIEAHEGTISIDSIYQKGTTVTIKLPIETERMEENE